MGKTKHFNVKAMVIKPADEFIKSNNNCHYVCHTTMYLPSVFYHTFSIMFKTSI